MPDRIYAQGAHYNVLVSRPLLFRRARVLTMDSRSPEAEAVLTSGGRIVAVGSESEVTPAARQAGAEEVELGGKTLVPGFIDAHIHLLGYAVTLISVDCGQDSVTSVEDIQARIKARASTLPEGAWIRAFGYDELILKERRHLTRQDLDIAAPGHPVRLTHRSGHACVLNSRALTQCGISSSTPEPPGGYMERDLNTGEPTGLLIEMNDIVERAMPPLSESDLQAAVEQASHRLQESGITFIQDASHKNGIPEWRLFERLMREGRLKQGLSLMEGYEHLGDLPARSRDAPLVRGPVKVMPKELEHDFYPSVKDLAAMIQRIDTAGRKAAMHAVTRRGISTVLDAFQTLGARARGHRIEHCGVCSAAEAARIAGMGLEVVTQPGFLYANGDIIRKRLAENDFVDLYPLRRLIDAGVQVAGSSDAPVIKPDVIAGLRAAICRRSRSGAPLQLTQALDLREALALFTSSAARALRLEGERGRITSGLAADLVVLNQDPTSPDVDWDSLRVDMTVLAGEVRYLAS